MEKTLEKFIEEINNVMGVRAAYLINNRGEILFPSSEKLGRSFLDTSGAVQLVQAMGIFELPGEEIIEMELNFRNSKIVIYHNVRLNVPTKLGAHESFLVTIGDQNFNKAHLRMTLNVSVANVITHKKYKKLGAPVRILKSSMLTREKLQKQEFNMVTDIRSLIT